jgi:hypothetical protein
MQKRCQEEADKDKERYKAELVVWKAANPGAGGAPAKAKATKKPHSAYILFLKDFQCVLCRQTCRPVARTTDTTVL